MLRALRLAVPTAALCLIAPVAATWGSPAAAAEQSPVAVDDHYATRTGVTLDVSGPGVLANDTYETDGSPHQFPAAVNKPAHGELTRTPSQNPQGGFEYVPDPDFEGVDRFTYCIKQFIDGESQCVSNTATVFIEVRSGPPVAVNDRYSTPAGLKLTVSAPGILANDDRTSGEDAERRTTVAHGGLLFSPSGFFTYTPDPGFHGTDTFTYCINAASEFGSGTGCLSNVATVRIDVIAPVAANDTYATPPGQTLRVTAPGVLSNDSDLPPDARAHLESSTTHGTLFFGTDGGFAYTPGAAFSGPDTFTYCIKPRFDLPCESDTATVTIHVIAAVAVDDVYSTPPGQSLSVQEPGVLANDSGVLAGYDATRVSSPSHGTLTLAPSGRVTYVPSAGFEGTDSFTYCITRASPCLSNIAVVTIRVAHATELVAQPVIARLNGLQPTLYLVFEATLTASGAPVSAKTITFSVPGRAVCIATTNAAGVARCGGALDALDAIRSGGYTATFAGDARYLASSARGGLLALT